MHVEKNFNPYVASTHNDKINYRYQKSTPISKHISILRLIQRSTRASRNLHSNVQPSRVQGRNDDEMIFLVALPLPSPLLSTD